MKFCPNHKTKIRVFAKGLCAACYKIKKYTEPLKRTTLTQKPFYFIKKVADKRKEQNKAYAALKKSWLLLHPVCEIGGLNCQIIGQDIHHQKGKEGDLLLDTRFWKVACRNCHHEINENSKKAIEDGDSISRHKAKTNELDCMV